jgi:hypothetical protein
VSPWGTPLSTPRRPNCRAKSDRFSSSPRAVQKTTSFGYLAWHLVAENDPEPHVSGFDVAIIRDDVIAELYTVLTTGT